jgi:uncharacterized protein YutE (UPF0331/DUF86 family)
MVDAARLRALLDHLRDTEAELARLRDMGRPAVRNDRDRLNSVKYLFVVAAETAIDAGQHVIASEGLAAPDSFAAVFEELGRHGWLPEDLVAALSAMARFRNLLVHGYTRIDDDRVVDILHTNLDDIARFRDTLAAKISQGDAADHRALGSPE